MIGYGLTECPPPPRTFAERLDSMIGLFSPEWAAKRVAWRRARADLERFGYRSATRSRTDRQSSGNIRGSATWHLEAAYERESMMFRARELERDNGLADGLLSRSVENVVGTGIKPQARTEDKDWNKRAEELFAEWAETCDVRGFDSFYDLQALTFRSYLRDGDVGTLFLSDGRLQSIEADQIADPIGQTANPRFIDGVETDVAGRPVRYHIVDESDAAYGKGVPDRRSIVKRIEIPAADMLFLSRRKRLNQTRGEPVFAQSAWLFDQIDGNVEAVTIAARIAACFGLVIERAAGYSGLATTTGANGEAYRDWSIEPGMVKELQLGDKLSQINPAQPTQNFSEFIALMARLVGIPLGLPYEIVMLDFSKANFSSMRGALIQAYKAFRAHQVRLVGGWCRPIWVRNVERWVREGKLSPRADAAKHAWTLPGWQWVDPKAEVDSALTAIDAGIKTLHDVITEQGRDYDEVIETRAREIKDFERLKIPIVMSASTRDPMDPEAEAKAKAKKASTDRTGE
jgi:lambda family phage portal protein